MFVFNQMSVTFKLNHIGSDGCKYETIKRYNFVL